MDAPAQRIFIELIWHGVLTLVRISTFEVRENFSRVVGQPHVPDRPGRVILKCETICAASLTRLRAREREARIAM